MAEDDDDFDFDYDDGDEDHEAQETKGEEGKEEEKGNQDDGKESEKSENNQEEGGAGDDINSLNEQLKAAQQENEKLKRETQDKDDELEELRAKQEEGSDSIPSYDKLMDMFVTFAKSNNLGCAAGTGSEVTEEIGIGILSEAEGRMKKPAPRATVKTSANCDESELVQRVANLEEELRLALGAAEDIRALKAKAIQLVDRIRLEKEDRLKAETEVKSYVKKMEMLSDHIEKLMIHLKHEAAAKIKAVDQLRGSEKRNEILKDDMELLTRKATAKERLIAELREGSKILEDQLRLMDEKYLELRTKLDYAREVAGKKVRNAQKTASELRVKFALAGNQKLLDHLPLPDIQDTGGYDMGFDSSQSLHSLDSSHGRSRSKPKKPKKKKTNSHISQDAEQSTERVLDKIRRLRGGEQDWDETKCRNLANTFN